MLRVGLEVHEGRKWYIDMANNAEYERAVISRRTRDQMAAAKRRGKKFGRPRKMTPKKMARARLLLKEGKSIPKAARRIRVSPKTLRRALAPCKRGKSDRCRG